MPILNVQANNPGQAGVKPNLVYIETNDPLATVMATGYLTNAAVTFGFSSESMLLITVVPAAPADAALVWLAPSNVNGVWTAVSPPSGGGGSGTVGAGTTGQVGQYPGNGTSIVGASLVAGTNVTLVNTPGSITINSTASGGGVNPGLQNEIAYYAAAGSQLSGLVTSVNAILATDGFGAPSIQSILPAPVQSNITTVGALGAGSLVTGFTPVTVPLGGTGDTSFLAFSVLCGGATTTGNLQNVASLGSAGQALLSSGAGALPVWGNVASVAGATTVSHIAVYTSTGGALGQDPITAFTSGNLAASGQIRAGGDVLAGATGVVGGLVSFPVTVASGSLALRAANNSGNFDLNIVNESIGQSSIFTLRDPGGSGAADFILSNTLAGVQTIASFLTVTSGNIISGDTTGVQGKFRALSSTAGRGSLNFEASDNAGAFDLIVTNDSFAAASQINIPDASDVNQSFGVFGISTPPVVGNMLKVLAASGVIADAGFAMRPVLESAAAGGSATQNFVDAFCTTTSTVIGNWVTQSNPASVLTIVPNNGSFDVTSTADAGAGTFSYVIYK